MDAFLASSLTVPGCCDDYYKHEVHLDFVCCVARLAERLRSEVFFVQITQDKADSSIGFSNSCREKTCED